MQTLFINLFFMGLLTVKPTNTALCVTPVLLVSLHFELTDAQHQFFVFRRTFLYYYYTKLHFCPNFSTRKCLC